MILRSRHLHLAPEHTSIVAAVIVARTSTEGLVTSIDGLINVLYAAGYNRDHVGPILQAVQGLRRHAGSQSIFPNCAAGLLAIRHGGRSSSAGAFALPQFTFSSGYRSRFR